MPQPDVTLEALARRLPVTGYCDRLSARPGETLAVKVAAIAPGRCTASLLRVISADPNPEGPGLRYEDLAQVFHHAFAATPQPIRIGSYGEADMSGFSGAATWTALICPGMAPAEPRVLLHHGDGHQGLTLSITPSGLLLSFRQGAGETRIELAGECAANRWLRVWASLDPGTGRMSCGFGGLAHLYRPACHGYAEAPLPEGTALPAGVLRLAMADPDTPLSGFNGRIEDPAVLAGFRASWPDPLCRLADLGEELLAGWDLGQAIDTQAMIGVGPLAREGRLVNVPTRGVTGARWTGREHCWRHAPQDYAAIRFHDDDLGDLGWQTSFTFTLPEDLPSGAYALKLATEAGEDMLPFYALPKRGGAKAHIAFLASTYTYMAYGNHARGNVDAAYRERVRDWGAYPHNPDDYPIYGRSTYNLHRDDTGISQVTRARPLLTMRPGFLTFVDAKGSGLRHYPADTHLLAWLDDRGFAFDIVTDEDLDREGAELLEGYRVVLTGTHPEYHTADTLDALQAHVRGGGGLCYLGGNGFYWRIGRDAARPDALEMRRAEGGVRAWAAEPGEYYHQSDGMLGGLWKRGKRDPQHLVGVGFSTQGAYEAGWFRRSEASRKADLAWMFEGITSDVLGNYGLNAGGAAGFELDRAQAEFGTPGDAVVVARSEGLPASFYPAMEDLCFGPVALGGVDATPLIRGDMIYFETAGGGRVFAASAITFCGSLWKNGAFGGEISTLLDNIVQKLSQ